MPDEFSISERRYLTRLIPALRLVGAIRQAFDLRKLMIAALGLALLQAGWSGLDRLVPIADDTTPEVFGPTVARNASSQPAFWSQETVSALHLRLSEPIRLLTNPLFKFIQPGAGWAKMLHGLTSVIWLIAVWGICGGAISRIAIVHAAVGNQTGVFSALKFALAHAHPLIVAPLCALAVVMMLAVFNAGFGLLYRIPAVGPALAGIGLLLPLLAGLVMTLAIAGLTAGWPVMQAAVAGGAEDALDALSRIFGYLNQRLGTYAALVALAWVGGLLGLALIDWLASGVIRVTFWSVALAAPLPVAEPFFGSHAPSTSISTVAGATHGFWIGLVDLIAHGWAFSYFWTAAAYLYLWLRFDVDGIPWVEIDPPRTASDPAPPAPQ